MADKAPSALTAAGTLDGTEIVHVVKGGNSRRTTTQAISDLGGGGWKLAHSSTIASPVAAVDVTDLGGYTEILCIGRLLTASASGNRQVLLSTDNGSTFYTSSGNYVEVSSAGVESNTTVAIGHATASSSARTVAGTISNNIGNAPRYILNAIQNLVRLFVADNANVVNAVRFQTSSGNLTGGDILVFGR